MEHSIIIKLRDVSQSKFGRMYTRKSAKRQVFRQLNL